MRRPAAPTRVKIGMAAMCAAVVLALLAFVGPLHGHLHSDAVIWYVACAVLTVAGVRRTVPTVLTGHEGLLDGQLILGMCWPLFLPLCLAAATRQQLHLAKMRAETGRKGRPVSDPILIVCEGSGAPSHPSGFLFRGICSMCGQWVDAAGPMQVAALHTRQDILAMLERGDFNAAGPSVEAQP